MRILFLAYLGKAQVNLQVDVGFGDAVNPKAILTQIPTVLDLPAPKLRAYPKETVVAEKFEAMVKLGISNSRMKDFWDVYNIVSELKFNGQILQKAVTETFKRRNTKFPEDIPFALTKDFTDDKAKQVQWNAFLSKNKLNTNLEQVSVIDLLKKFWSPLITSTQAENTLMRTWNPTNWS